MINDATIHDILNLVKLEEACFAGDRLTQRNFRYLLTRGNCRIVVYREHQSIVGACIALFRRNSATARLYSLAVHPDHQGKGIAQKLLENIEQSIARAGCRSVILEVRADNVRAIELYQKRGYEIFGNYPHYYEDKMAATRMKKPLSL